MGIDKPMRTFVYLPLKLNGVYMCSAVFKLMNVQIKEGDVFIAEKRPASYSEQKKQEQFKAVSVIYNLSDSSCLVEIEPKNFTSKNEMEKFLSDKSRA